MGGESGRLPWPVWWTPCGRDHVGADGVVSLYVNDYNTPAMALYHSLGFEQVGLFATVLL